MARMFIKHEPIALRNAPVMLGRKDGHMQFNVDGDHYDNPVYVCFVHKGICYAAQERKFFSNGTRVAYFCVPLEDQPCVQQMLLIDMILN